MATGPVSIERRRIVLATAGLMLPGRARAALVCAGGGPTSDPFTLGVASGAPAADGFVIWTRLAPQPLGDGGMPDCPVPVDWEVAADDSFHTVVAAGVAVAEPAWAHSLHVEVGGLAADREYWYRFRWGDARSPTGRARTAPLPGARLASFRFAYASCQHFEQGYYAAYRHLAAERPDLILHLGDYIYESSTPGGVRHHQGGIPLTLAQYRNRHACYKLDADLRAAHAACPWLAIWDDHDVENDYAGDHSQGHAAGDAFRRRRAAAYQAYWEHMPLRNSARPTGPDARLYQRRRFGDLLTVHLLDTRQYRDDQPCDTPERGSGRVLTACDDLDSPSRTMLGAGQERWLLDGLARGTARWNVIAQPLMMAPLDQAPGPAVGTWTDGWDGYPAARERILNHLADADVANPVVIGGDIHSFWASELAPAPPRSAPVATEFTGTSVSSFGVPYKRFAAMLPENPHVRFFDSRKRGYVACELRRDRLEVAFRAVDDVRDPGSGVSTLARFAVESGRPRIEGA